MARVEDEKKPRRHCLLTSKQSGQSSMESGVDAVAGDQLRSV